MGEIEKMLGSVGIDTINWRHICGDDAKLKAWKRLCQILEESFDLEEELNKMIAKWRNGSK